MNDSLSFSARVYARGGERQQEATVSDDYTPSAEVMDAARELRDSVLSDPGVHSMTLTANGTSVTIGRDARHQASPRKEEPMTATEQTHTLVTPGDPEGFATIPRPSEFQDAAGNQTDYRAAPDIERIADALIARCRDLAFLQDVRVRYLWRRKGQNKNGKLVLGTCQKLSGLPEYALGGGEFLVLLNAENCRLSLLRAWQLEALVYHELNHIAPPDEEDPASVATIVGHDVEMFTAEVRRYGLWTTALREAKASFEDLPLFGGGR